MDQRNGFKAKVVSLILLGFSLLYLVSAFSLKIGTLRSPGPGFFPLMVGTCLMVLTAVLVLKTFGKKPKKEHKAALVQEICQIAQGEEKSLTATGAEACKDGLVDEGYSSPVEREEQRGMPREAIAVIAATFSYPFLLVLLKFVVATFLVCSGMLLAFKPRKPAFALFLSLVLALGCFFFFARFFGVSLPSGFIEVMLYRVGG